MDIHTPNTLRTDIHIYKHTFTHFINAQTHVYRNAYAFLCYHTNLCAIEAQRKKSIKSRRAATVAVYPLLDSYAVTSNALPFHGPFSKRELYHFARSYFGRKASNLLCPPAVMYSLSVCAFWKCRDSTLIMNWLRSHCINSFVGDEQEAFE